MSWYKASGKDSDMVISTRVRLARNISGFNFPSRLGATDAEKIIDLVWESLAPVAKDYTLYRIDKLSPVKQQALIEKHLISPDLTGGRLPRAAMISRDESVSIMVNEEDHIRIQSLTPGLSPRDAWDAANKIDDLIGETIDYAFHERFGYLTSCPTNTGTGLRISAMLHLPVLALTGGISGLFSQAAKAGMTIRGLFGEGSEAKGNFYQFSNQTTLGMTEEELISTFEKVVAAVSDTEKSLRKGLKKEAPPKIIDRIMRSYGTMKYSYMLPGSELINKLSDVRLGIYLGIIDDIPFEKLTELMVITMPANISGTNSLTSEQRDIKRSLVVRETLNRKE